MSKPASLTIGDVATTSGLTPATLRAWESRFGFPSPQRLHGGQRRYTDDDLARIRLVLRERAAGATLAAAIERAASEPLELPQSLFVRALAASGLEPQTVTKRTMIALSHALEDVCSLRAERALIVGAFQRRRFYARARERWRDLTREAVRAVVFADFAAARERRGLPAEVPLEPRQPLEREWAIVHLAPRSSVLLIGRELPGQQAEPDPSRRFELIWSADPALVRDALETSALLAQRTAPAIAASLDAALAASPHQLGLDPSFLSALTNRMIAYLDPLSPERERATS